MEHRPVAFDKIGIEAALGGLPLGGLRVFQSIGSTNDEGLAWISKGAADMSLVVADEQTAGRGRSGRKWLTPPGAALALSMILRGGSENSAGRLAGLGAMAVADACASLSLQASIKWPNDVLLGGRKFAGILVEAQWSGNRMDASVIGIGINVLSESTPLPGAVHFPATSIEDALGHGLNRLDVLRATVSALLDWRPKIHTEEFRKAWEGRLAFRGDWVLLTREGRPSLAGRVLGLDYDGSLQLMSSTGVISVSMGEIHLQPADDRMN